MGFNSPLPALPQFALNSKLGVSITGHVNIAHTLSYGELYFVPLILIFLELLTSSFICLIFYVPIAN